MIPLTGTLQGESFTATPGKRGDWTIAIEGERGRQLAIALGARRGAAFHFTPARAAKWHALWLAGFSARPFRIQDETHWRYAGAGQENLIRRAAVVAATNLLRAVCPDGKGPPPKESVGLRSL